MSSWSRAGVNHGNKSLPVKSEILEMANECELSEVEKEWFEVKYKNIIIGKVHKEWNGSLKTKYVGEEEIHGWWRMRYGVEVPSHFDAVVALLINRGFLNSDKPIECKNDLEAFTTGISSNFERQCYFC
jgi:hypothetical protein